MSLPVPPVREQAAGRHLPPPDEQACGVTERALLAKWRDALRDSELDTTAKAVGYVIATYWNGRGLHAFPAKLTIAAGASLRSVRAVDRAVLRLEQAGFLEVERSHGRSSNTYAATLPTPHDGTGSTPSHRTGSNGSNPVPGDAQPRTALHLTPYPRRGKALKALKAFSCALTRAGNRKSARSRAANNIDLSGYDA